MLTKHKASGFTLIEVLIAVLVLAIGLLGLAGLQAASLRQSNSAYMRSQASILASDMLDRIRANRASALNNNYDLAITDSAPTVTASSPLHDQDLNGWRAAVAAALPAGVGSVDVSGRVVTIVIRWVDDREDNSTVDFQYQSQI